MFNFLKSPTKKGEELQIHIDGMHCTSCAMTIDDEIEEIEGVFSSRTTYAKGVTAISYDPTRVSEEKFHQVIKKLGYRVKS
jgi:copper chaperone CopZ